MGKIILAILLLSLIVVGIWSNSIGIFDPKSALKLVVTTGLDENETAKVTNVTFEQTNIPFFYRRADIPAKYPDINVYVKYNTINSEPKSYWSSLFRPNDEGIYILTVTFRDGKEPKLNDTLILPIKLTDFKGRVIYKTTAFYEWKQ